MDPFEVRAVLEIYERTIHHPNLGGLRTWALSKLNGYNNQAMLPETPEPVAEVEPEPNDEEDE